MNIWLGQWKVNNLSPSFNDIEVFLSNTRAEIIVILQMEYNVDYLSIGELIVKYIDSYKDYHIIVNQQIIGVRLNGYKSDKNAEQHESNSTCLSVLLKRKQNIENLHTYTIRSQAKYLSSKGIVISIIEIIDFKKSLSNPNKGKSKSDLSSFRIGIIGCNLEVIDDYKLLQINEMMEYLDYLQNIYNTDVYFIMGDINNRLTIPEHFELNENGTDLSEKSFKILKKMLKKSQQDLLLYDSLYNNTIEPFRILTDYFNFLKPYKIINEKYEDILPPTYKIQDIMNGEIDYISYNLVKYNRLQIGWLDRVGIKKYTNTDITIKNYDIICDTNLQSDHIPVICEFKIDI